MAGENWNPYAEADDEDEELLGPGNGPEDEQWFLPPENEEKEDIFSFESEDEDSAEEEDGLFSDLGKSPDELAEESGEEEGEEAASETSDEAEEPAEENTAEAAEDDIAKEGESLTIEREEPSIEEEPPAEEEPEPIAEQPPEPTEETPEISPESEEQTEETSVAEEASPPDEEEPETPLQAEQEAEQPETGQETEGEAEEADETPAEVPQSPDQTQEATTAAEEEPAAEEAEEEPVLPEEEPADEIEPSEESLEDQLQEIEEIIDEPEETSAEEEPAGEPEAEAEITLEAEEEPDQEADIDEDMEDEKARRERELEEIRQKLAQEFSKEEAKNAPAQPEEGKDIEDYMIDRDTMNMGLLVHYLSKRRDKKLGGEIDETNKSLQQLEDKVEGIKTPSTVEAGQENPSGIEETSVPAAEDTPDQQETNEDIKPEADEEQFETPLQAETVTTVVPAEAEETVAGQPLPYAEVPAEESVQHQEFSGVELDSGASKSEEVDAETLARQQELNRELTEEETFERHHEQAGQPVDRTMHGTPPEYAESSAVPISDIITAREHSGTRSEVSDNAAAASAERQSDMHNELPTEKYKTPIRAGITIGLAITGTILIYLLFF